MNRHCQKDDHIPINDQGYGLDQYGGGGEDCFIDGSGASLEVVIGHGCGGEGFSNGEGHSWSVHSNGNGKSSRTPVSVAAADPDDWILWQTEQGLTLR